MKVFISMPMNGKPISQIVDERNAIAASIQKMYPNEQVDVLNTIWSDYDKDTHPLTYLGRSIIALADADIAYFAEGWEDARGCRIEHTCAIEYGKLVVVTGGEVTNEN